MKWTSDSYEQTLQFGERLAKRLKPGDILCLFGDLGTGKTTLTKGIAKALKIKPETVNSPTFVLLNIYEGRLPVYHFDLYRIGDVNEIYALHYEEYLYGEGVSVIEWADRLKELLPADALCVELRHKTGDRRSIRLFSKHSRYQELIRTMDHEYSRA